jgi:hypothetical protein
MKRAVSLNGADQAQSIIINVATRRQGNKPPKKPVNKDGPLMRQDIPANLRNLDFSRFTDAEIMEHFNYRCQISGSTFEVALHHLNFQSQGGQNGPRIPLAQQYHSRLHSDSVFRKKWELKLYKIAKVFYVLKTQMNLF